MTSNLNMAQRTVEEHDGRTDRGDSAPAARQRLLFTTAAKAIALVFFLVGGSTPLVAGPEPGKLLFVDDDDVINATGRDFGHWVRTWYTWFASIDSKSHPAFDPMGQHCDVAQENLDPDDKRPFFLVNNNTGAGARQCRAPANRHLFVPIVYRDARGDEAVEGADCVAKCPDLLPEGSDPLDSPKLLSAFLDGVDLDFVVDLGELEFPRKDNVTQNDCFPVSLPADNFFGEDVAAEGEERCAFVRGYWLLLGPLDDGTHRLDFSASLQDGSMSSTSYTLFVGSDCESQGVVELVCDDGDDNDCDGFIDIADTDCAGVGPFVRGDCDGNGAVGGSPTEAVVGLNHTFRGGPAPPCRAACDAEANGELGVTDYVRILRFSFAGGDPPDGPFPDCGATDLPGDVALGCETPLCP